jgi:hypothetical protein
MKGFYDDCLRTKLADTCEWVLSRAVYHDWCSTEFADATAKFLWINAPAGFGKTVMCASLIQHFAMSSTDPLAYFFFSAAAEAQRSPFLRPDVALSANRQAPRRFRVGCRARARQGHRHGLDN